MGGSKRAYAYSKALQSDVVICYKQRAKANVISHMELIGDVTGKNVVLVDDMVDNDIVDNDIEGRKVFTPYHIGEKVEINWEGHWYLGEVSNLNRKDFTYAIEFMNWDDMEGIWLDIESNVVPNRLRQPTFIKTGMSCQIIHNNDWYNGSIIVEGNEVNFKYDSSNTMIEYDIDNQRLRWIDV